MKSVLVTGCSPGGIGSALVMAFQRRGLLVFATTRNVATLAHLKEVSNVHLLPLEVTDTVSIAAAAKSVAEKTGGTLDYLVNNAGVLQVSPLLDSDIEESRKTYDVNFWGALAVIQAFAPLVIAAKGTIVNNSSVLGYLHPPYGGIYASSKAALTHLTDILAIELAPFSVKVVTLVTGLVSTHIITNGAKTKLSEKSLYKPITSYIDDAASGKNLPPSPPPDVYAEKVVAQILAGKTGHIWEGGIAKLAKFLVGWMPAWVADSNMTKNSGLDVLKEAAGNRK